MQVKQYPLEKKLSNLPIPVHQISHQIIHLDAQITSASIGNDALFVGKLGLSLYHYSYYEYTGSSAHLDKGRTLLDEVFHQINANESSLINPSLSGGLTGFLSLLNFLVKKEYVYQDFKEFEEVDKFLFKQALHQIEHDFNDYLHGAFGILNYFLNREQDATIQLYTECIIEAVLNRVVTTKEGAWIRNYVISKEEAADVNLSLSHGQTGFALILLKAFEQGIAFEKLHDVVRNMISFILKQSMQTDADTNRHSIFPNAIQEHTGEKNYNNRLAWCYGDLNQSLLLYRAGAAFGIEQYIEIADLIGACSLDRLDESSTMCFDAHFCHGSAGVAGMYQALFNASGREYYKKAVDTWIQKTVEFVNAGKINIDFKEKEYTLLEGKPAVALTLLDYLHSDKGSWKEFFLLK